MTRRKKQRQTEAAWTLARVLRAYRSAPAVWLALLDLSEERNSRLVTPTRDMLVKRTGIARLATISTALTVLGKAGWVDIEHIPRYDTHGRRTATLLRIQLRRSAQKTSATEQSAVRSVLRYSSSAQKTLRSPYRGGRVKNAASLASTAADAPVESKATRIERERLAAIRGARGKHERHPVPQEAT